MPDKAAKPIVSRSIEQVKMQGRESGEVRLLKLLQGRVDRPQVLDDQSCEIPIICRLAESDRNRNKLGVHCQPDANKARLGTVH